MNLSAEDRIRKRLGELVKRSRRYEISELGQSILRIWTPRRDMVMVHEILCEGWKTWGWPVFFDERVDWYLESRSEWPLYRKTSQTAIEDDEQKVDLEAWLTGRLSLVQQEYPEYFAEISSHEHEAESTLLSQRATTSLPLGTRPSIGLFPVDEPWQVAELLPDFAAGDAYPPIPPEVQIRLFESWHQRCGVTFRTISPKFLEVSVARPPISFRDRERTANEILAYAPDSLAASLEGGAWPVFEDRADFTSALVELPVWIFFWD